jgi:hypothetical protein
MGMDIRVGAVEPVGPPGKKPPPLPAGFIEAKVLDVRPARRGDSAASRGRPDKRRNASPTQDPPGARVLVLMILDGTLVPGDLQTGPYRTFIRFARR